MVSQTLHQQKNPFEPPYGADVDKSELSRKVKNKVVFSPCVQNFNQAESTANI